MAGSARLFSAELRLRRQAAGLSLSGLARRVHYSKGYLSKIETGLKQPNADLARRCDAALDAAGELAALAAPAGSALPPDVGVPDDGEVWMVTMDADGSGRFMPVSRRSALAASTVSLLEWRLAGSVPTVAMSGTAIAHLGALFDELRLLGRAVSPAAVLPAVIAQAQTLRVLAADAKQPDRDRLLLLAGRHAEYAGWMAQEAGDDRAALWWTDAAIELAAGAGDRDLQAYGLVRRAGVLLYRDDAQQVVELASLAQRRPGIRPRIRALAARREAQGHSLAGDYDRCLRALDRANELLDTDRAEAADSAAAPLLGSTSAPNQHALVAGWCLYDLGRPRQSAQTLDRVVGDIPSTARRAAARFGVRRALAHAAAGEVAHACTVAEEVLDAATATDSATIRHDLRRLARTVARWRSHPAVRELQPRLATACRTAQVSS
jgi:hypothetical protein